MRSVPFDGISLTLLVFVVLYMVVYYWSLWSFAWWLEGQHFRGQHLVICLTALVSYKYVTPTP
jgi:hypothetical protein